MKSAFCRRGSSSNAKSGDMEESLIGTATEPLNILFVKDKESIKTFMTRHGSRPRRCSAAIRLLEHQGD
jgi:hypothetical protein